MHPPILLFDFDGVILTQNSLEYTALKLLRKKSYGWNVKKTKDLKLIDYARLFEESDLEGSWKSLKALYKSFKSLIPSRVRRLIYFGKFNRNYKRYEKYYDTMRPGLEEALKKFKHHNIPMGIVSNTAKSRLKFFRKQLKLERYFSIFLARDDTRKYKKPHPYPILWALKLLKEKYKMSAIHKDEVYYFGDLPTDIECAQRAKVNSIGVLSGHGKEEDLLNSHPTFTIRGYEELINIDPFKKFLMDS